MSFANSGDKVERAVCEKPKNEVSYECYFVKWKKKVYFIRHLHEDDPYWEIFNTTPAKKKPNKILATVPIRDGFGKEEAIAWIECLA